MIFVILINDFYQFKRALSSGHFRKWGCHGKKTILKGKTDKGQYENSYSASNIGKNSCSEPGVI